MDVLCVEDVSQVLGDLFSHFNFGNVLHCILHQVELSTLPRRAWYDRFTCVVEPLVSVAAGNPARRRMADENRRRKNEIRMRLP